MLSYYSLCFAPQMCTFLTLLIVLQHCVLQKDDSLNGVVNS